MQTSLEHTLTLEAQSRLFTKKLIGQRQFASMQYPQPRLGNLVAN